MDSVLITYLFKLIGAGSLFALIVLGLIRYGAIKQKYKTEEDYLERAEEVKKNAEDVINHEPGSGIRKLRKLRRKR